MVQAAEIRGRRDSLIAQPIARQVAEAAAETIAAWIIADARQRYREVFFLGSGGTDLLTRRIGVEPVGSDRFQMPEYESPANAYPSGVRCKEEQVSVCRCATAR